ncbi:MAG: putative metal-binding motif-containing protein [Alphaproteobacteria bacterium]|nr:putative metal-binding motif-containing protein [Alphaproteobacteria bacterium]MCB9797487.1 putative metal-binding motif-containing protein [Alphaproteobacteria bacterium]
MLLLLALLGCNNDADYDGFSRQDDCDDEDATVYPGAPDLPADGIDADCDGVDPEHPFVGDWELTALEAYYFSYSAFVEDSGAGELEIDADMGVDLEMTATLDPDLVGRAIPIAVTFEGDASALAGPGEAMLYLDGDLLGDAAYADLVCQVLEDETLSCEGALKTLDVNLEVFAVFE